MVFSYVLCSEIVERVVARVLFWVFYRCVLGEAVAACFFGVCCFCASFMIHSVRAWHWFGLQFSGGARVGSSMMHL